MNKKYIALMLAVAALPVFGQSKYITRTTEQKCAEKDLTFLVTFDKQFKREERITVVGI